MTRPRLLDLFCGAGGAAKGYQRAGFYVVGVDNRPQPRYCGEEFILGDALEYVAAHGREYDVIHASPPCQRYTALRSVLDAVKLAERYADLLGPTRHKLLATGRPFVIENVPRAPMEPTIILCAATFGLRSYRHRLFESNRPLSQRTHLKHVIKVNPRGVNRREHWAAGGFMTVTGDVGSYVGPEALGIDWMTGDELREAIPPAYTEFIGRQLIVALTNEYAQAVKRALA